VASAGKTLIQKKIPRSSPSCKSSQIKCDPKVGVKRSKMLLFYTVLSLAFQSKRLRKSCRHTLQR
jgi:hypothetical protein